MTPPQSKDTLYPLAGGCACGFIRYHLTRPPFLVHCCYCTACQLQTGTAFAINAVIESASLVLLPSAAHPTVPASSPAHPDPVPAAALPAFASSTGSSVPSSTTTTPEPLSVCVPSESGLGTTVVHCPRCLTGLWNHYADGGPHLSYVRVGTLDRPWAVDPDVHIYTRSRRAFIQTTDGKPQFEEYYNAREEVLQGEALQRWLAVQPLITQWRTEFKATLANQQGQ